MTCKDCIHEDVCSALIKDGLPWEDGKYPAEAFCLAFRNKSDVVEVVRCKDCKYFTKEMIGDDLECFCKCVSGMVNPADDFYCSYGERREE